MQITHLLSMDSFTARYFKGIAMRDTPSLPLIKETPALYILNTDSEMGSGEHWCAVLYKDGVTEFYDPFGFPPSMYGLQELIMTRTGNLVYNTVRVQNLSSNVCGHHCLFYAYHRCRDYTLRNVLKMFNPDDTVGNDRRVTAFVVQFGTCYYPK